MIYISLRAISIMRIGLFSLSLLIPPFIVVSAPYAPGDKGDGIAKRVPEIEVSFCYQRTNEAHEILFLKAQPNGASQSISTATKPSNATTAQVYGALPYFGLDVIEFLAQVDGHADGIAMNSSSYVSLLPLTHPPDPASQEPSVYLVPTYSVHGKRDHAVQTAPVIVAVAFAPARIRYDIKFADGTVARHFSNTSIQFVDQIDPSNPPALSIVLLMYLNSTQNGTRGVEHNERSVAESASAKSGSGDFADHDILHAGSCLGWKCATGWTCVQLPNHYPTCVKEASTAQHHRVSQAQHQTYSTGHSQTCTIDGNLQDPQSHLQTDNQSPLKSLAEVNSKFEEADSTVNMDREGSGQSQALPESNPTSVVPFEGLPQVPERVPLIGKRDRTSPLFDDYDEPSFGAYTPKTHFDDYDEPSPKVNDKREDDDPNIFLYYGPLFPHYDKRDDRGAPYGHSQPINPFVSYAKRDDKWLPYGRYCPPAPFLDYTIENCVKRDEEGTGYGRYVPPYKDYQKRGEEGTGYGRYHPLPVEDYQNQDDHGPSFYRHYPPRTMDKYEDYSKHKRHEEERAFILYRLPHPFEDYDEHKRDDQGTGFEGHQKRDEESTGFAYYDPSVPFGVYSTHKRDDNGPLLEVAYPPRTTDDYDT